MTLTLDSITLEAKAGAPVEVSEQVFDVEINRNALYLALRRERINAMRGTANSKTRSEVSGGGKKPWKQKGTGRARAGSIRSPLWVGGGVIFGPKPRKISIDLNRKLVKLAHRSALSNVRSKVVVLESTELESPKTSTVVSLMKTLKLDRKQRLLLIIPGCEKCENLMKSARNIPSVSIRTNNLFSVHDLMTAEKIVIAKPSLEAIQERLR